MYLSARILSNVANVNSFDYDLQASFTEGDSLTVYIQLIDLNKDKPGNGFKPAGKRYVPEPGAVLQVDISDIVTVKSLTKLASQPFAGDASIWAFSILPTDSLKGTRTIKLTLTEGSVKTFGSVNNGLSISPKDGSFV